LQEWAKNNMLDYVRLVEVKKLVEKIMDQLREKNFWSQEMEQNDPDATQMSYMSTTSTSEEEAVNDQYIIKFIVAGAFYPNYFRTTRVDESQCQRMLSRKDPKSTVAVMNFYLIFLGGYKICKFSSF
jgi:ATP-dependent RNA helicase TDRD9